MPQSRNFVFTRQATNEEAQVWMATAALVEPFKWYEDPRVKAVRFQIERAPTTMKLHCQGFIAFKNPCRMAAVKKLIGNNAHVEFSVDPVKAWEYAGKTETRMIGPWTHGDPPVDQGTRTDLTAIWDGIKAGKRTYEMMAADPKIARYEKAIKYIKFTIQEGQSDRQKQGVKVYVFYGATDLGKTYTAINLMDPNNCFKMDPLSTKTGTLWFDGYEGERTLIMDEFEGDNYCSYNKLKVLLDVYKCRLEIKGSFTWACWTTVILCSNSPPREWYPVAPTAEHILKPLQRRIYQIRHFVARGVYEIEDWEGKVLSDQLTVEAPPTAPTSPAGAAVATATATTAAAPMNADQDQDDPGSPSDSTCFARMPSPIQVGDLTDDPIIDDWDDSLNCFIDDSISTQF